MVLRKTQAGDSNSSGAYIASGGLLAVIGVVNLTKDDSAGVGGILLTVAGGALLLVGLIIFAIAESKKDQES